MSYSYLDDYSDSDIESDEDEYHNSIDELEASKKWDELRIEDLIGD